jgi:glycoside/pentoside/hexuronide:cation symporter, GPH family
VQGRAEGRWFGWWSMATKLTLALAAGIALPLVQWLGYQPGARDMQALAALGLVYALLPCAIKAVALLVVWRCRQAWSSPGRLVAANPGDASTQALQRSTT